jgi:hypothetical protein
VYEKNHLRSSGGTRLTSLHFTDSHFTSLHFTLHLSRALNVTPPQPTHIIPHPPSPLNKKRSYSLVVMTQGFSAVVHHIGGQVSYPGGRAQPPADTTERWEIIDLLLPVGRVFNSGMVWSLFAVFLLGCSVVLLLDSLAWHSSLRGLSSSTAQRIRSDCVA